MRKLLLTATIPLLTMLILIACNQGTFVSEGNLRFTGVTVNKSRATIGDEIEILWDYENANRLAAQRVKTVRLLFQGLCSPDFCPEPIGELESSVRSATFVFEGPTTVVLDV